MNIWVCFFFLQTEPDFLPTQQWIYMVIETLFSIVNSRYQAKGQVFPWFYQVCAMVLKMGAYTCILYLKYVVWSSLVLFAQ